MFIVMHTYWNPAGGSSTKERVAKDYAEAISLLSAFLEYDRTIEVRIITSNPMPT